MHPNITLCMHYLLAEFPLWEHHPNTNKQNSDTPNKHPNKQTNKQILTLILTQKSRSYGRTNAPKGTPSCIHTDATILAGERSTRCFAC